MGLFAQVIAFLGPWSWWVLGLLLAVVEIVVPGTFFIWFAIAAILTGVIALIFDPSWQWELILFIALAVGSALVGRFVYGRTMPTRDVNVNARTARQVGRLATLETAIVNGSGHIRLDDTTWRVEGPDLSAGVQVRIVGYRDGRLQVEPV